MISVLGRSELEQKDMESALELELSTEMEKSYKIIDKTENILSAMLLITEGYRKSNTEVKDKDNDIELMDKIESLVYETVELYHTDRSLVRDVLSLMIFYIRTLKLKDIISADQTNQLLVAYSALVSAYDKVQIQKDTLENVNIKDIDLAEHLITDLEEMRDIGEESLVEMAPMRHQIASVNEKHGVRRDTDKRDAVAYEADKRHSTARGLREQRGLSSSTVTNLSKRHALSSDSGDRRDLAIKDIPINLPNKRQDSRRSEILRLLSREPITIKDISARVLGCSEKTIQRELNSMLDDGTIMRIGEKRWSKYIIA